MNLSAIIERFGPALLAQRAAQMSHEALRALSALRVCQTGESARWQAACADCGKALLGPHACGHRSCPHCQHGLGEAWRQRQLQRLLPVSYFLVTFTLPAELRPLARRHPRRVFDALMRCAWDTLRTFARNDRRLAGEIGASAVLHTHSRTRDFHPHVHLLVPAGGLDPRSGLWRSKAKYLFRQKSLATVFRARLLATLREAGLCLPGNLPEAWVVDCRCVGRGDTAVGYLSRYLYRGVLSERDLLGCDAAGSVSFRYREGSTGDTRIRSLPGVDFLALLLQHVLPKGFHRVRDFGLLHPRRSAQLRRIQLMLQVRLPPREPDAPRASWRCPHCGGTLRIIATRLPPHPPRRTPQIHAERSQIM